MTRFTAAVFGLAVLMFLVVGDFYLYRPNPYQQPAVFALGSGAASSGGFCGSLPE